MTQHNNIIKRQQGGLTPDIYWSFDTDLTADIGVVNLSAISASQDIEEGKGVLRSQDVATSLAYGDLGNVSIDGPLLVSLEFEHQDHTAFIAGRQALCSMLYMTGEDETYITETLWPIALLRFNNTITFQWRESPTVAHAAQLVVTITPGLRFLVLAWRDLSDILHLSVTTESGITTTAVSGATANLMPTANQILIGGTGQSANPYPATDWTGRPRVYYRDPGEVERNALIAEFLGRWGI